MMDVCRDWYEKKNTIEEFMNWNINLIY
jgi:hypothetical protein